MLGKLRRMQDFADTKVCRRKVLLQYFGEELTKDCGNCDNCQTTFEELDGTEDAQKAALHCGPPRLVFWAGPLRRHPEGLTGAEKSMPASARCPPTASVQTKAKSTG